MPYLYDGIPDKPAWLRRRFMDRIGRRGRRREIRRIKKGKPVGLSDPKERKRFGRRIERSKKRYRVRKTVVSFLTDRTFTFILTLFGAPVVAVQVDRLTRDDGTGSVPWMIGGIVLLVFALWFDRTRETVEANIIDINETEWLQKRFEAVVEEVTARADDAEQRAYEANQQTQAALRTILARLEAR